MSNTSQFKKDLLKISVVHLEEQMGMEWNEMSR